MARSAEAQACDIARIWVDPAYGYDNPDNSVSQINDPAAPCRTLQFAIDRMNAYLRLIHSADTPDVQGIVYAMPGLYGPHGTYSSGDSFPIWMQDRVHVQGVGARECVIRGGGANTFGVFWPTGSSNTPIPKEVLVSYRDSSQFSRNVRGSPGNPNSYVPPTQPGHLAPWAGTGETAELIDGFTFEGGDVQILIAPPYPLGGVMVDFPLAARITNCLFDMRDQWVASEQIAGTPPLATQTVNGPTFGVMMAKPYHTTGGTLLGYYGQEVLIGSNTFVMAEWKLGAQPPWIHRARVDGVAIVDVTDPLVGSGFADPNPQLRGLGQPNIINNLFRTWPGQQPANVGHMAMLGIDEPDTRVKMPQGGLIPSNAFVPGRVSALNQTFRSTPVQPIAVGVQTWTPFGTTLTVGTLYNCTTAPPAGACPAVTLPTTRVVLWDGTTTASPQPYDPAFVGEYLTSVAGIAGDYRDWRLLPDSPLVDQGVYEDGMTFENGVTRFLPGTACAEIDSWDWDGEVYGNPRIVGEQIDIGFDEVHMLTMAGSYANDSNGHNDNLMPASFLHPSAPTGSSTRHMILPILFSNSSVRINGTMGTPVIPAGQIPISWAQPPLTLTPPSVDSAAVRDFHLRYIQQTNPAPAVTPWTFNPPTQTSWTLGQSMVMPGNQQVHHFVHLVMADVECSPGCTNSYFNTQAYVDFGGTNGHYRSNLQVEYR